MVSGCHTEDITCNSTHACVSLGVVVVGDDDGGGDFLGSFLARRVVVGACKIVAKRYPKEVSYH